MTITAIAPAHPNGDRQSGNLEDISAQSGTLEDITHGCAQCGTTLTRTVRPLAKNDQETAVGA